MIPLRATNSDCIYLKAQDDELTFKMIDLTHRMMILDQRNAKLDEGINILKANWNINQVVNCKTKITKDA